MVGAEGFEPPTLCSQSRCATRLRYAPTAYSLSHRSAIGVTGCRTNRENPCRTEHGTGLQRPMQTEARGATRARLTPGKGHREKASFVSCVFAAHPCCRLAAHSCGDSHATRC